VPCRPAGRRASCAANLTLLGRGLEAYNTDYKAMPSAHRNVWWLAAAYGVTPAEDHQGLMASDPYRCPQDTLLTDRRNGCSYGLNYEAVDPFGPEPGRSMADNGDARNQAFSPFSNYKLPTTSWRVVRSRFLGLTDLGQVAAQTVLLVEVWDPQNVALFGLKFAGRRHSPIVEQGEVVCPRAALADYNGRPAGTTVAGAWFLLPGAPNAEGTYLSLRVPAARARDRNRSLSPDREAYHQGRINVLFADQHTESVDCSALFARAPVDTSTAPYRVRNPVWTRTED
jgi:prepilin-type processing-associated H-X9-DG protein